VATKTSAEVKQELDDLLLEDTVDADPWTLDRKRRAINRAIRSSWPNFKLPRENATAVALAADTYKYPLSAITDIEDVGNGVGIVQVLLEPLTTGSDWIQQRQCTQSRDASGWNLYVPERLPLAYAGKKCKLRYYARLAEFVLWNGAEVIPAEISNYVVYSAAADLFGLFAQGGSDFNVEDLIKLIPLYQQRAQTELQRNTVHCMPIMVGIRKAS
jgi:hypothetical protein